MNVMCLLTACSGLGLLISLYFNLVYYGIIGPDQWFIPRVCRMEEGVCHYIIHTSEAKALGVPNFVLGIIYYCSLIMLNVIEIQKHELLYQIVSALSVGVVLLGGYLTYALLFKLRTNCVLCFTSHGLNFVIMILLIIRLLTN
jgi:uncharacterized membrane protein